MRDGEVRFPRKTKKRPESRAAPVVQRDGACSAAACRPSVNYARQWVQGTRPAYTPSKCARQESRITVPEESPVGTYRIRFAPGRRQNAVTGDSGSSTPKAFSTSSPVTMRA